MKAIGSATISLSVKHVCRALAYTRATHNCCKFIARHSQASVADDAGLQDFIRLATDGAVIVFAALLDLVDIVHAFDNFTPDRILLVEETRIVEANEKLRIRAVRI